MLPVIKNKAFRVMAVVPPEVLEYGAPEALSLGHSSYVLCA
jgi:hypothetical protein